MVSFYGGLGFIVFWVGAAIICLYIALRIIAPFIWFVRGKINPFFRYAWNICSAYRSINRTRSALKGMTEKSTDEGFIDWLRGVDRELRDSQHTIKNRMRIIRTKSLKELESKWREESGKCKE